jgi:hypothetical protein
MPSMLHPSRFLVLLVVALVPLSHPRPDAQPSELRFPGPRIIVWAWERPEDLQSLSGRDVGVAYLAKTFFVSANGYQERPRLQPLAVASDTWMMAVVRIEAAPGKVEWDAATLDTLALRIAALSKVAGVHALQVDFDATASQRDFYGKLLARIRRHLAPGVPLSITALASWCMEDDWVSTLPVDEAVPMLFRMGKGTRQVRAYVRAGGGFVETSCAGSVGLSTDEPLPLMPPAPRRYVFSNTLWTEKGLRSTLEVSR